MKTYKEQAHTEGLAFGKQVLKTKLAGKRCLRCYADVTLNAYRETSSAFMDGFLFAIMPERDKPHHRKHCAMVSST